MNPVAILGGGPAGAAAAIAACREGSRVTLIERSRFPRHKVCGEFLSPGTQAALDNLGLWSSFQALQPALIRRMIIRVGGAEKINSLPDIAFGLSRYAFDSLLWNRAIECGAQPSSTGDANLIATGRASRIARGGRLFGFKAHFKGPVDDAVELYFAGRSYTGVNCVEGGLTNVCGLAPEEDLKRCGFDVESLILSDDALRARLKSLSRCWNWIFTGPLVFGNKLKQSSSAYLAGDALSFVDPFTGSGLLAAVATGTLAGRAAGRKIPVRDYQRQCRDVLGRPFGVASILRHIASTRAAGPLLQVTPSELIFRWTRPRSYLV